MTRFFLAALPLIPVLAFAQVEKAADVRVAPVPATGPGAAVAAPAALSLSAPALSAAPAAAPLAAAAPPTAPAPLVAPAPSAAAPASVDAAPAVQAAQAAAAERKPSAAAVLALSARLSAAPNVDAGVRIFDAGAPREAAALTMGAAASDGPRLERATARAAAPAPAIPFKRRAVETAELGAVAAGFHLLTGLGFLILGAHAAFPALAGAFWVLAGSEMIKQLGRLRGVIVGGWQASHDQKMRHDYGTGELKDIRGHKYGEDRYDEWAAGPVSTRERLAAGAAAFALGLPWVVAAGPKAVALYALGASGAFVVRRLWRLRRPEPAPANRPSDFEYDR